MPVVGPRSAVRFLAVVSVMVRVGSAFRGGGPGLLVRLVVLWVAVVTGDCRWVRDQRSVLLTWVLCLTRTWRCPGFEGFDAAAGGTPL